MTINVYNTAESNHMNTTLAVTLSTTDMIQIVFLGLTLLVGFVGNILVITIVSCNGEMLTRTNIFLLNLAVVDFCAVTFCVPLFLTSLLHQDWRFGDIFCQVQGFINPFCLFVSVFTLIGLSVHKYFSIAKPVRRIITTRRALIIIIVSWIVAAFCSAIGPVVGWNRIVFKPSFKVCGPSLPERTAHYLYLTFLVFIGYIFPIIVMASLYFRVFQAVKAHCKRIRKTRIIIDDRGILGQKRILVTVCIVIAIFIICWTPFYCHSFLLLTTRIGKASNHLLRIAYTCGFLSKACNPIVYFVRNSRFRRGFCEIVLCKRLQRTSESDQLNSSGISISSLVPRQFSPNYLAEKRCSFWYFSGQKSLLNIVPVEPERRLKLRWIETNL